MRIRSLPLVASIATSVAMGATTMLSVASPAHADPDPIVVAQPSHNVAHPDAVTEWWYVNVQDPASGQSLILTLMQKPSPSAAAVWFGKLGAQYNQTLPATPYAVTSGPKICGSAGCIEYVESRNSWHVTYAYGGTSADLWLNQPKPGVTSTTMFDGKSFKWTNPVATSSVTGWVKPIGHLFPISADGWRGYHDHNWGTSRCWTRPRPVSTGLSPTSRAAPSRYWAV